MSSTRWVWLRGGPGTNQLLCMEGLCLCKGLVSNIVSRGIASSKQVRGPQHNMLAIANVNQDIETALKQDKSEGAMAPLGPIVATPVIVSNTFSVIQ